MTAEAVHEVDRAFLRAVAGDPGSPLLPRPTETETASLLALFDAAAASRHLDLLARELRSEGRGFYTIGSSGHESNGAVALATRPTDPALLHYRSGAFYLARAGQVDGHDGISDVVLGLMAASSEPVSGGRHKVFGHPRLAVIPQTSTIASHLPRALGVAFAIERAKRLGLDGTWPPDAIAICSFGDASANHSTAVGAINAALHAHFQGLPIPLLLVCEDNGIGISVPTPSGWIAATYGDRPGLRYFTTPGDDPGETLAVAANAAAWVRRHRAPAFLHLRTVRLMGHAGADHELAYRSRAAISADLARDPLLVLARDLVRRGVCTKDEVVRRYEDKRRAVAAAAHDGSSVPRLTSRDRVVAPLTFSAPAETRKAAVLSASAERRLAAFGESLPETESSLTLAESINRTLTDVLAAHTNAVLFGEDVGRKGGVYGVTRRLVGQFGHARVFDTLLDEQSILGVALGLGVSGMLPIAEIQYLAYLHNAEDQLRGEAASLAFFSERQFLNPMIVRVASYAYQRGFGGHFHNDNSVAVLRDIPGIVIASPARPEDAAAMLRTCVGAALAEGRVCVFLEPIALYHSRDLHEEGDGGWLSPYAPPEDWDRTHVPIGRGRTYGQGDQLTIVSFGNGLVLSLRAVREIEAAGIRCRVLDLRWLAPLPVDDLLREASATGAVLVVDETRRSGGVSEAVVTELVDHGFPGRIARLTAADSYVPLGDAADLVLVSVDEIVAAGIDLVTKDRPAG